MSVIIKSGNSGNTANVDGSGNLQVVLATNPTITIGKVAIDQTTPGTTNGVSVVGTSVTQPVADDSSQLFNGPGTPLTPLFAPIAVSASGASTVIAAVGGKSIRVIGLQLIASAAVNVKWQSHVTPTDLTGFAYFATNGGYVLPYNPLGWFQTIAGEALDINLSGAIAVGGSLVYVTV